MVAVTAATAVNVRAASHASRLACEPHGHESAIGDAGREDAAPIDGCNRLRKIFDQRDKETNVVGDALGPAAEDPAVVPTPLQSLGIGDRKAFTFGDGVKAREANHLRGGSKAAMQQENQRHCSRRRRGRHMGEIAPHAIRGRDLAGPDAGLCRGSGTDANACDNSERDQAQHH